MGTLLDARVQLFFSNKDYRSNNRPQWTYLERGGIMFLFYTMAVYFKFLNSLSPKMSGLT